jgi:serine/threonine-protein kinase HipA
MAYATAPAIEVSAWNRVVGAVALDPVTGYYAFEYEEDWAAGGIELSPLHLPNSPGVFIFPELLRKTYYGLPAMLADALPDRFGSALVTAWMADQGIEPDQITALDRLAYAGDRAMGALCFAPPATSGEEAPSIIQVADLVTAARAQLVGSLDADGSHEALEQLITVGSTAGGARAKAVIAYNPHTGQMRSGQLDAPEGFEQWLLKLDGVGDPTGQSDALVSSEEYCRVEYAYCLMAGRAGIEMVPSMLLPEGPRAHFMTKRFDRGPDDSRIHLQSLCGLAHLDFNLAKTHSYASWLGTARQLGLGADAAGQIFRRIAFNIFGVNRDDHTKNAAFLLPEAGNWQIAPAYDVTHSNWDGEWTQGHQMSVNGKFIGITLDDLRSLADRYEVPDANRILVDVAAAVDTWPDAAREAGVDDATTSKIATELADFRPR